jgi:hypothetical protein
MYKNEMLCMMEKHFHLNNELNLKINSNKLKYKYKIICIEVLVNNNMFNTCNNN